MNDFRRQNFLGSRQLTSPIDKTSFGPRPKGTGLIEALLGRRIPNMMDRSAQMYSNRMPDQALDKTNWRQNFGRRIAGY